MTIDREELEKGSRRIFTILSASDPKIEGVEVNLFEPTGLKEWSGLKQTARTGITQQTNTSAMEVPSASFTDDAKLNKMAHQAMSAFQFKDESINGLTLSVFRSGENGKLERQSVAVGYAWLPPEPPANTVSSVAHEERSLVNDPFGYGMGVQFPS